MVFFVKPVQFGDYKDVNVGETAFAKIGHPGELIWSFNSGMVQLRQDYKWKYNDSHHFADVIDKFRFL